MEPKKPITDLQTLAAALSEVRDAWLQIALTLKDQLANDPSPEQQEAIRQVLKRMEEMTGKGGDGSG